MGINGNKDLSFLSFFSFGRLIWFEKNYILQDFE